MTDARGGVKKKLFLANTYERNCPKKNSGDTERRRGMRVEGIPRVVHTIYAAIYIYIYIYTHIYLSLIHI